jgi:uncharacterized membrane protein required for colicin V production
MTIQDQIYTIWFPLGIMLLFAVVGALRGVAREALVSAALVLGGLIITLWAGQWSPGLHDIYSGMSQGQEEFTLAFSVLWLVVLVVGYGMGGFVPKGPLSSSSRLSGFVLGLANGAAVAGWSLRLAFSNLQDAQPSSPFYTNPVSFSLMVWSVWFPVALAILGALFVLIGPLRRAQTAVAQPAPRTDWEPYAAPPGYAQAPAGPAAPGLARGMAVPPPSLGQPVPYSSTASQTTMLPSQAAPPTTSLPTREAFAPPTGGQPPAPGQPYGAPGRGDLFAPRTESETRDPAGQAGDTSAPAASQRPSWLHQSTGSTDSWAPPGARMGSAAPAGDGTPPSDGTPSGGTSSAEAPTMPVAQVPEPGSRCPHCGTPVAPGAQFCTECGTKLS